jgi:hypothetical protein
MVELRQRVYGRVDLLQFEFTDTSPTEKLAARAGADIIRIAARFERLLNWWPGIPQASPGNVLPDRYFFRTEGLAGCREKACTR